MANVVKNNNSLMAIARFDWMFLAIKIVLFGFTIDFSIFLNFHC